MPMDVEERSANKNITIERERERFNFKNFVNQIFIRLEQLINFNILKFCHIKCYVIIYVICYVDNNSTKMLYIYIKFRTT